MVRFGVAMKWIFALALFVPLAASAQSPPIAGTWALAYVAPQAATNTLPTGVSNQKLVFTDDGKLYFLPPDKTSIDDATAFDYVFDGKRLKLTLPAKRIMREMSIAFEDSGTMVMTQPYDAKRIFKRIKGFDTRLEPQSLELIADGTRSEDSRYDHADYSGLPFPERAKGMWEVIAYDRVPRGQLPPYGFFNDLWKIDASAVTIFRRAPAAQDAVPFAFADGKLISSGIGLGARAGTKIEWAVTFNEWGQLVLDSKYCRMILKRTLAKVDDLPSFPLKVVVVHVDQNAR